MLLYPAPGSSVPQRLGNLLERGPTPTPAPSTCAVGEFRGVTSRPYVFKEIGPGTTVRRVTVRGARAWWIAGNPHGFAY